MIYIAKTELTKQLEKEIWGATHKQGVFGCFEADPKLVEQFKREEKKNKKVLNN